MGQKRFLKKKVKYRPSPLFNRHGQRMVWGTVLVEIPDYYKCEGERAETVDWLGRNSSWVGEGGSEIRSGCIMRSRILTTGQKREMGR